MRGDPDNPLDDALCKGAPKIIWFPNFHDEEGEEFFDDGTVWEEHGDTSEAYEEARVICEQCPVKDLCLSMAMERKERFGMWGGLTPIERRRIERRDRRRRLQERRRTEAAQGSDPIPDPDDTLEQE